MRLREIIQTLEQQGYKVRQGAGERFRAQCPGHGGEGLNLSLYEEPGGKVKAWCWSEECSAGKIAEGMGLKVTDFVPPTPHTNGTMAEPEAVYSYRDEAGEPLFEVVRMPGHEFWQRLPGTRKGGIGNVRRVLFGLPDLLATEAGELVLVVEGEKDAINAACLGVPATTNPHGAGHWRQEYTDWLKRHLSDRRFVILPDNDEKGQRHAEEVYEALRRAGLDVRVVALPDLPAKGDVSDWIKAGGTGEQLRALCEPPPHPLDVGVVTGRQLDALDLTPPQALVPNLVFRGYSTLLAGDSKLGKSSLILRMLLAMATGGWWLDPERREENRLPMSRVMYLNFEDRLELIRHRAQRMMSPEQTPENFLTRPIPYGFSLNEIIDWLGSRVEKFALDAVILDPIAIAAEWEKEEDNAKVALTFKALARLATETNVAVLSTHHVSKKPGQYGLNIRGASAIKANVMGYLVLQREKDGLRLTGINKMSGEWDVKLGRDERDYSWWIEQSLSGNTRTAQQMQRDEHRADLLTIVSQAPGQTTQYLADWMGISERTCWQYLKDLEASDLIVRANLPGTGEGGRPATGWFRIDPEGV